MTTTTSPFRRAEETDAYRVLHNFGFAELEDSVGSAIAHDLINRWADRGLVKISFPDGWLKVQTFKKYAKLTGADASWPR